MTQTTKTSARWYILHVASGSENRIKTLILENAARHDKTEMIEEIVVPTFEVPEFKRGKKVLTEKKFMPGYILVKAQMNDDIWHLIKQVPKVSSFLGAKNRPQPLSDIEAERIFAQMENETKVAAETSIYNVGDKLQVIDGPFENLVGVVEEVEPTRQRLKILVSIFDKNTPIELNFNQVKKN